MDEAGGVGGVEGRRDLGDDPHGLGDLEVALPIEDPAQVGALDQVHRDEQEALLLAGMMDLDHVRVAELDGVAALVGEATAKSRVACELRRDHLERHDVVEGEMRGPVDDPHPTAAGNALDPVTGEDRPGREIRHPRILWARGAGPPAHSRTTRAPRRAKLASMGADRAKRQPGVDKTPAHVDVRIAARASGEDGVLTTQELIACGLTRQAVAKRARCGRLHRLYRGVYAVGHRSLSIAGRVRAALKAVGTGAVISHRSAAVLWGYLDAGPRFVPELTLIGDRGHRRRGIRVHRTTGFGSAVHRRRNLPVTSPLQTILDCATVLSEAELRAVLRRAFGARQITTSELARAVITASGRRGVRTLRRILAEGIGTRSELEDVVLHLLVSSGFERPDVNVPLDLDGRRVIPDFRWPSARLVLEADGAAWHDNPIARTEDRERQRLLEAHGERVIRVTWRQAVGAPDETRRRIGAAGPPLARRAGSRSTRG